ncbi:glutamine--fructose-6-phosphate transaminase (isomerizing) [bacterium]|jgi:glutamine---fructose-6-phosphate transaminase (isomerizing)|nr:glutamine--fructose-6-phosphate transaminase (isomerizing) [bacterium]
MCGIVGYIGPKDIETVLLVGLERLSYRGYDSAGIATIFNGELSSWKKPGKLHVLSSFLKNLTVKGNSGIGHTRWATHGEANEVNAHPHVSQRKKIAIVHNGIIENFLDIKKKLEREGHIFRSQTDTEVIVHLIERYYQNNLEEAVEKAVLDLKGTYAIAVVTEKEPEKMVVTRKGSPLILGVGKDENYISSDINAIIPHTKDVIYMDDNEIGIIKRDSYEIKNMNGVVLSKKIEHITWDSEAVEKSGYDHFMLKEITEQPSVIRTIISKYVNEKGQIQFNDIRMPNSDLAEINRLIIQACGTSWHAGLIGKFLVEQTSRVLTEVDISSEFRYKQMISQGKEIVAAISQSGETADTIACIREAKAKFFKILSFVNVKGSTIDRESDGVIYSHSGREIGVASTKNFLAQLTTMYLFSIYFAQLRWMISEEKAAEMVAELKKVPEYIETILTKDAEIEKIAEKYHKSREFIFVGRGINFPSALEGALKLKEISYIHATGYPAGELKHGPIALIDEKLPVVCIATHSATYEKMVSNIQEIKARKGKIIVIATEGDEAIKEVADDVIYVPKVSEELSPLLVAVPLQMLAYHIAVKLECDVDQPRNLAKSVTVE